VRINWLIPTIYHEIKDEWMIDEVMFRHFLQLIRRKSQFVEGRNTNLCWSFAQPSEIANNGKLMNWKCDMMKQRHSDKDLCNSNADQDIAKLNRQLNLQSPTTLQSDRACMMNCVL
jgi:hypothetical protein